jgi:hypothetical protein
MSIHVKSGDSFVVRPKAENRQEGLDTIHSNMQKWQEDGKRKKKRGLS